jgi:hypothetical protein
MLSIVGPSACAPADESDASAGGEAISTGGAKPLPSLLGDEWMQVETLVRIDDASTTLADGTALSARLYSTYRGAIYALALQTKPGTVVFPLSPLGIFSKLDLTPDGVTFEETRDDGSKASIVVAFTVDPKSHRIAPQASFARNGAEPEALSAKTDAEWTTIGTIVGVVQSPDINKRWWYVVAQAFPGDATWKLFLGAGTSPFKTASLFAIDSVPAGDTFDDLHLTADEPNGKLRVGYIGAGSKRTVRSFTLEFDHNLPVVTPAD